MGREDAGTAHPASSHRLCVCVCLHCWLSCSAGRDKAVKYWDMDRWELLLDLPGHHGDVQTLAVSQYGDFVVTGGTRRDSAFWQYSWRGSAVFGGNVQFW